MRGSQHFVQLLSSDQKGSNQDMDDNPGQTRYRNSERYVRMENNYQYMKARSVSEYNGGAAPNLDQCHKDQSKIKNYTNHEKYW